MAAKSTVNARLFRPEVPSWVLPIALLFAESCFIRLYFDSGPLRQLPAWSATFGYLGTVGVVALVMVSSAILILRGMRLGEELSGLAHHRLTVDQLPLLIAHLVMFALLVGITQAIIGMSPSSNKAIYWWFGAWVMVEGITVLLLLAVVVPMKRWLTHYRSISIVLLTGSSIAGLAWGIGLATKGLWLPLSQLTLTMVHWSLSWLTADILYNPATVTVGTSNFLVEIGPVCSGYEGIGLMLGFVTIYLWWDRRMLRFPRALLILPVALLLVWMANVVRITVLIAVGSWVSADFAMRGFHSTLGWILFCAISLAFVILARHSRFMSKSEELVADTWNPTAAYLMPLFALLATSLITRLFTTDFNVLYPAQVLTAIGVFAAYRHFFALSWSWSWHAVALGIVAFCFWMLLQPTPVPTEVAAWQDHLYSLPRWGIGGWIAFRILGAVLIVPIVEELSFRGYLMRRLSSVDFTNVPFSQLSLLPLMISSLIFGMLHQNYIGGVLAGALYALAQLRRGRLSDAILAHSTTNGLVTAYVLATGSWELWM